jgi:hypothetical protein
MPSEIQEQLIHTIIKTFNYTRKQANDLFKELMMCVKKRELVNIYTFFFSNKIIGFFVSIFLKITIFRLGEESSQDIDLAILIALLRSSCVSSIDQLKLALTWNRVDIARNYILSSVHQWPVSEQKQTDFLKLNFLGKSIRRNNDDGINNR